MAAHHQIGHTITVEIVADEESRLDEVAAVGAIHRAGIPLVVGAHERHVEQVVS